MTSLLLLGFLIGMRHALDADHLAAVAAISTRHQSIQDSIRHGAVWGLGHTITLFLFGSTVIWLDTLMPQQLAHYLEMAVGLMLIALGIDVIRRVIKNRIHYHAHNHRQQGTHFHAHSHAGEGAHHQSPHQHQHGQRFPVRTLMIGLMHGMAGSAALILITLDTMTSLWTGMGYMLLFGLGSMVGMALISMIIAIPLQASARRLTWMHNGLQLGIGVMTVGLGLSIVV
jgi:ABC-type nickel/cobalt efflux system permease component RcnA